MNIQSFLDAKSVDSELVALLNDIQKAIPSATYSAGEKNTYNPPEGCDPEGLTVSFDVFLSDDPYTRVAVVGRDKYDKRFYIVNRNIESSRNHYGRGEGNRKESIYAKNVLAVAKKTIKPLNIHQVMEMYKNNFERGIARLRSKWGYDLNQRTDGVYNVAYEDMLLLASKGYQPINPKFSNAMSIFVREREQIEKYRQYNPNYCFVWVEPDCVQFITKHEKEPTIVSGLNELPESLRSKMFVLDITDEQTFVEDIGLKENKTAYWVLP